HSGAMYAIGTMYWAGDGVPEDREEGGTWYELSEVAEKQEKESPRPFFEVLLK
ncbi:MAG: SEL1-like repeat protein, partial [Synergistaceae bacterium]|nr:SEL1-like repeat protein [Synergistaceae bacterium]